MIHNGLPGMAAFYIQTTVSDETYIWVKGLILDSTVLLRYFSLL